MIIDDEHSVGDSLKRALRHDVTTTTSAREALQIIASRGAFDMILSDLMMPEMSGAELYEELAKRDSAAAERVVFMTGGAFTPAARELLDRVPNERIEKPFDVQQLRELVEKMLR